MEQDASTPHTEHDTVEGLRNRVMQFAGQTLTFLKDSQFLGLSIETSVLQSYRCLIRQSVDEISMLTRIVIGFAMKESEKTN